MQDPDHYYIVISGAKDCPAFQSQYIVDKKCFYGYTTNVDDAETYIHQFTNSRAMGYAPVHKNIVDKLSKDIGLEPITPIECEFDQETDEPKFSIVATESEVYSLYEMWGDGFDTDDEDCIATDLDTILKAYKSKTSKKLRKCLRKFIAEIHEASENMVPKTKKYYIMKMKRGGLR